VVCFAFYSDRAAIFFTLLFIRLFFSFFTTLPLTRYSLLLGSVDTVTEELFEWQQKDERLHWLEHLYKTSVSDLVRIPGAAFNPAPQNRPSFPQQHLE